MTVAPPVMEQQLKEELQAIKIARKNFLREQILENKRLDILAAEVFGLDLQPFHQALQQFALTHKHSLQLAFRGSGKTTTVTEMLAIGHMLWNPDVRILIVSRTGDLAKEILGEIKQFIEQDAFIELFGNLKGPKWDGSKIVIAGRTMPRKEPTISTVGIEGQLVGKHFDIILGDDLIDDNNARTVNMREQTKTFYYKAMTPTLEPDGELHILGTRYHGQDIYGHLQENEMKEHTQIIPALNEEELSPWPAKYKPEYLIDLRDNKMGTVLFDTQYQCNADKMKGSLFKYDYVEKLSAIECTREFGKNGRVYIGVDLAAGQGKQHDYFAICAIRVVKSRVLVERTWRGKLSFTQQLDKIEEWFTEFDPVWVFVESNSYQTIASDELAERHPHVRRKPVHTSKDKVTRATKLAARMETGQLCFRKSAGNNLLVNELLLFPGGEHDDMLDALDIAVQRAFRRRRRKKRENEIGLM